MLGVILRIISIVLQSRDNTYTISEINKKTYKKNQKY